MQSRLLTSSLAAGLLAASVACSENTAGRVGLAFSTRRPPSSPLAASGWGASLAAPSLVAAGDSTTLALGGDTIIVRSVELVLREIALERVEVMDCDSIAGNHDCEEFATGPVLVSLPLGASNTATLISVDASPGRYDELEFEVHKPDQVEDAAFIAANPDFERIWRPAG